MEPGAGPVTGFWKSGHSCCPQGQHGAEWKRQCWQQSAGGGGWREGEDEDGERWRLAGLWESVTAGEFLREPFCLTTPPFWLGLFVLWTTRDDLCSTLDAASFTRTSSSPLEVAVRGSWPSLTSVLLSEGAFPLALREWCPPLLRARGSTLASLRAMVLSQRAWEEHGHSSVG